MAILEANNLSYFYQDGENRRYILKDTSISFEKGKFYTILGQSGSGKTTLLSLLSALEEPKEGRVFYNGKDLKEIGYETFRRNHVGIVFQHYNLIPYMTALENVMIPMAITENELPQNQAEVAYNLLDYIGIVKSKADRLVTQLSGGEQQRVAIARSLATNVDVILADEPTGNLDEEMEAEIVEIFKKLAHEHGKCVVVVTHSQEIASLSDEIYYLRKGKLKAYE
ncbi:putative ABC transport system ATP-binding protein [Streptococcus henryi]|jgi:putative ABC transport system ATP-binding protein|uniref:Putative ABC transport system ATP-binding protein n=1 Tax=Streptococcus henryi TaxID=439219 RepID=A0A1G6BRV5_9STRE|nr:ABC transporter ATP-binding protein [Streptococcus henryi]SDB23363.1 putative ABC transport system ATP-binding protein [Streptococcus henryi]